MSKRELIDRIRTLNPTAPGSFLARFDEADLNHYLDHLEQARPPIWRARPADPTPAVGEAEGCLDPRQLALTF